MITLFFPSLNDLRDFRAATRNHSIFISFEDLSVTGDFSEAEIELAMYGMNAFVHAEMAN